jgi:hypothetical protein
MVTMDIAGHANLAGRYSGSSQGSFAIGSSGTLFPGFVPLTGPGGAQGGVQGQGFLAGAGSPPTHVGMGWNGSVSNGQQEVGGNVAGVSAYRR